VEHVFFEWFPRPKDLSLEALGQLLNAHAKLKQPLCEQGRMAGRRRDDGHAVGGFGLAEGGVDVRAEEGGNEKWDGGGLDNVGHIPLLWK
jgi:hypothetical protein